MPIPLQHHVDLRQRVGDGILRLDLHHALVAPRNLHHHACRDCAAGQQDRQQQLERAPRAREVREVHVNRQIRKLK
jgi:hypothetical protein